MSNFKVIWCFHRSFWWSLRSWFVPAYYATEFCIDVLVLMRLNISPNIKSISPNKLLSMWGYFLTYSMLGLEMSNCVESYVRVSSVEIHIWRLVVLWCWVTVVELFNSIQFGLFIKTLIKTVHRLKHDSLHCKQKFRYKQWIIRIIVNIAHKGN